MVDWFEALFGFKETSPREVRANIELIGNELHSKANGKSYIIGQLTTPTLGELRTEAQEVAKSLKGKLSVVNITGDVRKIHCQQSNSNALFQVASQFNLLEMVGPNVTPEDGVTRYIYDHTQGPVCAMAAGAATVYRNYFAPVGGKTGQTHDNQLDCLKDVGKALGNTDDSLWEMCNGYALCTSAGLSKINEWLKSVDDRERDALREQLHIGLHWGVEVTEAEAPLNHYVSQAYCSALPVAYSGLPQSEWAAFARLILESAYEATLCAAVINSHNHGSNNLYLTKLGGGAFGNELHWIYDAMQRAFQIHSNVVLDVRIVSYGAVDSRLEQLAKKWSS